MVSEGLDRELPFWRRWRLRIHVRLCRACSRYSKQIESIDEAVSAHYRTDTTPPESDRIPDETVKRIKSSLRSSTPPADSTRTE